MAMDTRNERAGAVVVGLPFGGLYPLADSTIDQADRQQSAYMYPGILAGAPVMVTDYAGYVFQVADRTMVANVQTRTATASITARTNEAAVERRSEVANVSGRADERAT